MEEQTKNPTPPEAVISPATDPTNFTAPTTPLVPAEKPKNRIPLVILCIALGVIILGGAGYLAYTYLMKKPEEKPKEEVTSTEIVKYTSDAYVAAEKALEKGGEEKEIISAIDNVIASSPESMKKSMNIYEFFQMLKYELPGAALLKYYDIMGSYELDSYDLCALYDIRALLARFENDEFAVAEYRDKDIATCSGVPSEKFAKLSDESDFDYAKRLFMNGFISLSAEKFAAQNFDSLDDGEKLFSWSALADYYRLNREGDKYSEVLNKFLELANEINKKEEVKENENE